jgi:hypothetical protein
VFLSFAVARIGRLLGAFVVIAWGDDSVVVFVGKAAGCYAVFVGE